jgi:hypothetical protein
MASAVSLCVVLGATAPPPLACPQEYRAELDRRGMPPGHERLLHARLRSLVLDLLRRHGWQRRRPELGASE